MKHIGRCAGVSQWLPRTSLLSPYGRRMLRYLRLNMTRSSTAMILLPKG